MTKQAMLTFNLEKGTLQSITVALNAYLKEPNADINAPLDSFGRSALHISTSRGDEAAVLLLLQRGANINVLADVVTPLMIAIAHSNQSMVTFLLENDAYITNYTALVPKNVSIEQLIMQYSKTLRGPLPLPILISYTNALPSVVCEIINSYLPLSQLANTTDNNTSKEEQAQRANKGCCAIS